MELKNLAGTGDPDEARLTALAERTWPLDTLPDTVVQSQIARKLIDKALSTGREERWDFTTRSLQQDGNYVRRGDAFPAVERRGYLPYKDERKNP
jgi:choline-sulfatase